MKYVTGNNITNLLLRCESIDLHSLLPFAERLERERDAENTCGAHSRLERPIEVRRSHFSDDVGQFNEGEGGASRIVSRMRTKCQRH